MEKDKVAVKKTSRRKVTSLHLLLILSALFVFFISLKFSGFIFREFVAGSASASGIVYIIFVLPFCVIAPTLTAFVSAYLYKDTLLSKEELHVIKKVYLFLGSIFSPYIIMFIVYLLFLNSLL
ncbi:hypothetical protein COB87_003055 [Candidatus Wolfebacteria bacterium]|nr:hypothetical protein [Candidatus Wolfebacteria bacterium]